VFDYFPILSIPQPVYQRIQAAFQLYHGDNDAVPNYRNRTVVNECDHVNNGGREPTNDVRDEDEYHELRDLVLLLGKTS